MFKHSIYCNKEKTSLHFEGIPGNHIKDSFSKCKEFFF